VTSPFAYPCPGVSSQSLSWVPAPPSSPSSSPLRAVWPNEAQAAPADLDEGEMPLRWDDEQERSLPLVYSHVTVLRDEAVAALAPSPGGVYVDLTLGGGGHSEAILMACPEARVFGLDRDPAALAAATARLAPFGDRFRAVKSTFSEAAGVLDGLGVFVVDGLLADLGVSSPQIDDPERGMSFRTEGPLDMRMDPTSGETAAELIERLDVDELADVIFYYGDERRSRRIARCVKQASDAGELISTLALRKAVVRAVGPARIGGVDPATRTFQALRIAVNRELDELTALLELAPQRVKVGGILAIISFHSLEDRKVKIATKDRALWAPLTKKPQIPSDAETAENPRARSAKLRAARRFDPSLVAEDADEDEGEGWEDDPNSVRPSRLSDLAPESSDLDEDGA
jgi:16S rRNA (cytosine1402-N4)-methyltransferase